MYTPKNSPTHQNAGVPRIFSNKKFLSMNYIYGHLIFNKLGYFSMLSQFLMVPVKNS